MINPKLTLSSAGILLIGATLLVNSNVNAQEHAEYKQNTQAETKTAENTTPNDMEHSKMNHEIMPEREMNHAGMDHCKMTSEDMVPAMDHSKMKHDDMQAQGGDAPPNARDPHAY